MKVTFVSNFLNHHQIPFCLAMNRLCEGEFYFVAMEEMDEERKGMGWSFDEKYDFEIKAWENSILVEELINKSDVVIYGGASYAPKIHNRIIQNKITFFYSERVYKKGVWRFISPRGQYYMRRDNTQYKENNLYLLAASAYAPFDYSLVGAYKNKAYKWGYFPSAYTYQIKELIKEKEPNSILWVGRFIKYKHPEKVLKIARRLKQDGYEYKLRFIGNGVLEKSIKNLVITYGLQDKVEFLGAMSPNDVREYMKKAQIFLFTADKGEGWGAVLNESMNSGCAIVADEHIGAAPYLIRDNENGLLYSGSVIELYKKAKYLLDNREKRISLGTNAYNTIINEWNADVAAKRVLELAEKLLNKSETSFKTGPCSVHK